MAAKKVGLFGGTFDPVHCGHLIVARFVLEALPLDEVLFIPSAQPPHKGETTITAFVHRAAMVQLAIRDEAGLDLDDCESKRDGPSYTFDTVCHYRDQHPDHDICWIIGADSLAELHTWYRVSELVDVCEIISVCRPGWEQPDLAALEAMMRRKQMARLQRGILETPRIDISATNIRQRVATAKSIQYLVPDSVREYIEDQQLYKR